MIKSSSKGYILLESIIGLGILTTGVMFFLMAQTTFLKQNAELQSNVATIRVLYEEVQGQSFEQPVTYTTTRTEDYGVSFGQSKGRAYGRITQGTKVVEIVYEE
jgi:type II secretory pathway pseudopilin PulG